MFRSSVSWIAAGRDTEVDQPVGRDPHHHVGTADQRRRVRPVEVEFGDDIGHEPDATRPSRFGGVDRRDDLEATCAPVVVLVGVQQVRAVAGADHQHDAAVGTLRHGVEQGVHGRAQGSEPDATCGDHDVTAERVEVPRSTERGADRQLVAGLELEQCRGDRPGAADRVLVVVADGRRRADRDRRLADTEGAEHAHLRRQERCRRAVDRDDVERDHAGGLGRHRAHDVDPGLDHRVADRHPRRSRELVRDSFPQRVHEYPGSARFQGS